jgi:aldose 1-epimerase
MGLSRSASIEAPRRMLFGRAPNGAPVESIEIASPSGMRARIIGWGASLQSLSAPDSNGRWDNVILNYPDLAPYVARPEYFGASMGRFANRIGGASFTLDGRCYQLAANEGANILHGGAHGFDKALWRFEEVRGGDEPSVRLGYASADGEEGFPGALEAQVTYTLSADNTLSIAFSATTDAPTMVNMTNHSFFNLAGASSGRTILGHTLMIAADAYTPVDSGLIPTGELRALAGTPFDFRTPTPIGARIADRGDEQLVRGDGYDHNYVLRGGVTAEPKLAARLADPLSGRVLELSTTEPGLQFYTGQYLGRDAAATPVVHHRSAGLALEPQRFPDAPNKPDFASARLDPGETYRHVSVYRFTTAD